jgi:hypothetical protein
VSLSPRAQVDKALREHEICFGDLCLRRLAAKCIPKNQPLRAVPLWLLPGGRLNLPSKPTTLPFAGFGEAALESGKRGAENSEPRLEKTFQIPHRWYPATTSTNGFANASESCAPRSARKPALFHLFA